MTTPRVSVLTTAFNIAPYIGDALRSALEQTFEDIEIIVVDDGSTDDTVTVIRGFRDPRIQIVERPHEGPVRAINAALALVTGEFVAFLDGDDSGAAKNLSGMSAFLKNTRRSTQPFRGLR